VSTGFRHWIVVVLAAGVMAAGMWSTTAAAAQEDDATESIVGTVRNKFVDDSGDTVQQDVAGVRITVTDASGAVVAEAVTGEDGGYDVPLPGPGEYTIALDVDSLPEGVAPQEGSPTERTIAVNPKQAKVSSFFLGRNLRDTKGRWEILPQTLLNGLVLASVVGVCAIGLSLIYGTTGLSNFAHGELVTLGALVAWMANQRCGLHLLLAAPIGIAASAAAGLLLERRLWRPLRASAASLTSMMIVSIGIALGIRYLYQFFYGARNIPYRQFSVQREWELGPFSISPRTLTVIALASLAMIGMAVFLLRTRFGKAIRAVSDNPDLASATGINTDRVIAVVWLIGGALAGFGGILFGVESGVQWDMGFLLLLLMFAAITLGGLGNPFGALVGSLVVGLFVEFWTWVFPDVVELKTVGALVALIVLLLVRPQGLLGRRERIG
jgi:branched-subunit amino acid ABC-type transport system permease component